MNALYDLKEMLCKQLEDYGKRGELSAAVLERVDMLAHAVKNLDKIIECMEEEDSGSYDSGNSYDSGRNYSQRRDSMGRYSRRTYSRHGSIGDQLRDLMEDAPDDRTRQEIQKLASRLDQR